MRPVPTVLIDVDASVGRRVSPTRVTGTSLTLVTLGPGPPDLRGPIRERKPSDSTPVYPQKPWVGEETSEVVLGRPR